MKFRIETARPIKPMVTRLSVALFTQNDVPQGMYDIALDLNEYTEITVNDGKPTVRIDGTGIQQKITDLIAEMQVTHQIVKDFQGLAWESQDITIEKTNDSFKPAKIS